MAKRGSVSMSPASAVGPARAGDEVLLSRRTMDPISLMKLDLKLESAWSVIL